MRKSILFLLLFIGIMNTENYAQVTSPVSPYPIYGQIFIEKIINGVTNIFKLEIKTSPYEIITRRTGGNTDVVNRKNPNDAIAKTMTTIRDWDGTYSVSTNTSMCPTDCSHCTSHCSAKLHSHTWTEQRMNSKAMCPIDCLYTMYATVEYRVGIGHPQEYHGTMQDLMSGNAVDDNGYSIAIPQSIEQVHVHDIY